MSEHTQGWHVSKTLNLGHLITTMAMLIAAFWYVAGQDSRLSMAEQSIAYLKEARLQDQAQAQRTYDELRQDLRTINAKLDRLIETR